MTDQQLPKFADWITATIQCRGMKGNEGQTELVAGYVVTTAGDDMIYIRGGDKVRSVNLFTSNLQILPPKPQDDAILVNLFGTFEWMRPVGKGAYPYDCKSKDRYPDAMIYQNDKGGWITDRQLLKTKNGYFNYTSKT